MTDHDDTSAAEPMAELGADIDALLSDAALWGDPSAELEDRIVDAVRSEAELSVAPSAAASPLRRVRAGGGFVRPALLGAAAAILLLFGGVIVLSALSGVDDRATFSAPLTPTGLIADVDGSIDIVEVDSGLRIELDAPSLPRRDNGEFYEAWVRTADDDLISVGTFHGGERVTLWAGVELDRVALFTISQEAATADDSIEQGPSGNVVLRAQIGR